MKLLKRYYGDFTDVLYMISEWVAGSNTLSLIIGIILTLGNVFLALMLIGRVRGYNDDPFEESFAEAKSIKKLAQWGNSFMTLWLFLNFVNIVYTFQFGDLRIMGLFLGIAGYIFSWYSLKKFSDINRKHNIALAKENKGDPSIVMAESFGLTRAQKDAVSMIVGNAGASDALRSPKSDEELFGTIDDPVYDDPHTVRTVCRSCGKVNNPKHNICAYCGMPLDKTNTEKPDKYRSEIDKILNGTKKAEREDPVQWILRNAGVVQGKDGKYVSSKSTAEKGGAGVTEAGAKLNESPDKSITVTPLTENGILTPTPVDNSFSVSELKGTDFCKNSDEAAPYESGAGEENSQAVDSAKGASAESVFYGGKEGQIRCRCCGEMNDKNSVRCIYCGTLTGNGN